ncbi:MAG: hypothetical protein K5873_02315 [Treponema sp.]|nr:hypothetical protein [Treponema sp.]
MKKLLLLNITSLAAVLAFTGCGSTKIALKEQSPMAVITIIGNTQVPWVDKEQEDSSSGEPEAESLLTSLASKAIDGNNIEILSAVDRLDYAYDSFARALPELTGIEVMPKESVLESETYKYMGQSYFNLLAPTKKATGFKDFSTIGAKKARMFMDEIGAKSAMILSFTFQKDLAKGSRANGKVKGIVTLKAKMLDNRGRETINKIYTASSPEPLKIASGYYDKDALIASLNDTIDIVINQFCIDLFKMSDIEESPASDSDSNEAEEIESQAIAIPIKTSPSAQ